MTRRPHPVKAEIVGRGLTLKHVAEAVGVNAHTFGRVVNGHESAWPALRARLSAFLDRPEHALFRDDAGVRP